MTLFDFLVGLAAVSTLTLGGLAILKLLPTSGLWSTWPAQIALAHLVGAAVMAWIVTIIGLASGRLLILPVYLAFLVIAGVAWKRHATTDSPTAIPPRFPNQPSHSWQSFAIFATFAGIAASG